MCNLNYGLASLLLATLLPVTLIGQTSKIPVDGTAARRAAGANVLYIGVRTDGTDGDGSLEQPRDGSTPEKLDQIFDVLCDENHPPGPLEIRLLPGAFQTRKGLRIPYSWKVSGSGRALTRLTLTEDSPYTTVITGFNDYADVYISDLTINCNARGTQGNPRIGIGINCHRGVIERVTVLDACSNPANQEVFVVSLICNHPTYSGIANVRNSLSVCSPPFPVIGGIVDQHVGRISEVVVDGVAGSSTAISLIGQAGEGYANGIQAEAQWSGLIEKCSVINAAGSIGFGAGGFYNVVIRNCQSTAGTGINLDTHHYYDLLIEGCTLVARSLGSLESWCINFGGGNLYRNLRVINNHFVVDKNGVGVRLSSGAFPGETGSYGAVIEGNYFEARNGGNGSATPIPIHTYPLSLGIRIFDNRFSAGFAPAILSPNNVVQALGNRMLNGASVSGLPAIDAEP